MKIGVTGPSTGYTVHQLDTMALMINARSVGTLIHGGCKGIDCEADAMFERQGHGDHGPYVRTTEVYPTFKGQGLYAKPTYRDIARKPLDRDHLIAAKSDLLLVVPAQNHEIRRDGAWATCRYAVQYQTITLVILSDGTVRRAEEMLGKSKEEIVLLPGP
jgi:hypothetical protein